MANTYSYTFADQSGVAPDSTDPNPYNALLKACDNDPIQISSFYEKHRTTRATQQRKILTSPDFKGVTIDHTLREILDEEARPQNEKTGYQDPRHCAVLWGRPTQRLKELIAECQAQLKDVIPNAYFQPLSNLHITVLELAHSLTHEALSSLLASIPPSLIEAATELPHNIANPPSVSSVRPTNALLKDPIITYDGSALALSFLPAISAAKHNSSSTSGATDKDDDEDENYTYHHLRRDMWNLFNNHSPPIPIASRYIVPSAHMTLARFVSTQDTSTDGVSDPGRMLSLVRKVEGINRWLVGEFGGGDGDWDGREGKGLWTVGEETGLCFRVGRVWYGGGESLSVGRAV